MQQHPGRRALRKHLIQSGVPKKRAVEMTTLGAWSDMVMANSPKPPPTRIAPVRAEAGSPT